MLLFVIRTRNWDKTCTVTSRLFTHAVSTEKSRKEMRYCKDPRGLKHPYYNGGFFLYYF